MKRIIAIAALVLMSLCFGGRASAGNFGIIGGANFYTTDMRSLKTYSMTQWHAGLTYKINLPIGFQLQPALLYNVKGSKDLSELGGNLSVGYLELMLPVQWGVDLILFRPYLEVAPFVGYGLNVNGVSWQDLGNRMEYGVGLGGGIQIWRLQVSARYNWNFGRLLNRGDAPLFKNGNFSGVNLSLAVFF